MKNKKSVLSIAFSVIAALALVIGIGASATSANVKAETEEKIVFDVKVDGVTSKTVGPHYAEKLIVTYTVAENTGIDALQITLDYDATAFVLDKVTTLNTTALGGATISGANVVFDNVKEEGPVYTAVGDTLITAEYYVKAGATAAAGYEFGIVDANSGSEFSNAWRIVKDAQNASAHAPVTIEFSTPTVYISGDVSLTLTGNTKVYDGEAADDSEIVCDFDGDNAPEIEYVWFAYDGGVYTKLDSNPVNVGTYYVVAKTAQTAYWNAYCGYTEEAGVYTLTSEEDEVAVYTITLKNITIAFAAETEQYKTFDNSTFAGYLADPDYATVTGLVGEETVTISIDASRIFNSVVKTAGYEYALSAGENEELIVVSLVNANNYNLAGVSGKFYIEKQEVDIRLQATAIFDDGSFPYDGTEKTISVDVKGKYIQILSVSYSGGEDGCSNNGAISVGDYDITATFTVIDPNYVLVKDEITDEEVDTLQATLSITIHSIGQSELNQLVADNAKFYFVDGSEEAEEIEIINHAGSCGKTYDAVSAYVGVVLTENAKLFEKVKYTIDGVDTAQVAAELENFAQFYKVNAYPYTVTVEFISAYGYAFEEGVNAEYVISFTIAKHALKITATGEVQYSDAITYFVDNGTESWVDGESYTTYGTSADALKAYLVTDYQVNDVAGSTFFVHWGATAEASIEGILYNYDVTLYDADDLVVAKKIINAEKYDFEGYVANYDGATHTLVVKNADELITVSIAADDEVIDVADSGEYTATITLADASNYTFENGVNDGWTVAEGYASASKTAPVTISAIQLNINIDYTKYTATFSVTGFVGGETEDDLTGLNYLASGSAENISGNVYTINGYVDGALTVSATSENTNYTIADATMKNISKVEYLAGEYDNEKSGEDPVLPDTEYLFYGFTPVVPADVELTHYSFVCFATDLAGNNVYDFTQGVDGNKQIYAVWEENEKFVLAFVYMVEGNAENLTPVSQTEYYSDDIIALSELPALSEKDWFKVQEWFTDDALTVKFNGGVVLSEDTTLYGNYKFNIGLGDVNANGKVNANDITLYRQWIVGGYEMHVVEAGNEWATVNGEGFNTQNTYFLLRVADGNALNALSTELGDGHYDIRDVSTIRMAMVGGYGFSIIEGKYVDGEELVVIRTISTNNASDLFIVAKSGKAVQLEQDIEEPSFVGAISGCEKDVVIDLNGNTLTLKSMSIALAAGNTGKIEIKNGSIYVSDGHGITLSAPDGSVILDNVTLYDKDGEFSIVAADHSLHFAGDVKFLKGDIAAPAPASVVIPATTHVVVEEETTLVIEKIEVEEVAGNDTLSIEIISEEVTELVVDGFVQISGVAAEAIKPTCVEVASKAEILAAAADADIKAIRLVGDLNDIGKINFVGYVTIDGNGYTVSGDSSFKFAAAGAKVENVTFENIHNAASDLSAVYANALSGKLEIIDCTFDTFDWDAIQITPVAGGEVVVSGNTFRHSGENAANTRRYVHIQSKVNVDFAATVENNKFYNSDVLRDTAIEVYYPANESKLVIDNNFVAPKISMCILTGNGANAWELATGFVKEDLETPAEIVAAIVEPYNVYLFDDLSVAVDHVNAANGGTITLTSDVDFSEEIYAGYKWAGSTYNPLTIKSSNVTIDLNGHTISNMGNGALCSGNLLAADGVISNFTIKNGTLLAGKTNNVTNSYVLAIAGTNGASIKNVTTNGGINVYSGSTNVVIDGCAINGTKYYAVCAQSGSDVTIKNSEVTKNTDGTVSVKIMFWTQGAGSDSDMKTSANPTGAFGASVITIESGSYTMNADGVFTSGVKPVVKGGTFNFDPTACVAEGYVVCEADGTWAVVADLVEAVELINASANGGTITLTSDIDFSEEIYAGYKWAGSTYNPLTIKSSNVTIDLNGHTISNMGNTAICAGNILAADGGISNFTIKNGTLLAGKTSDITNSYVLGIAGVNGASIKNVTTNGGINAYTGSTNVVIDGCTVNGTKYYAICAQCGSDVTVKNTTVTKNTDGTTANKAMFWIDKAGKDGDMATVENPTGAFGASSITLESGEYVVNEDGIFYLASGLKPVVKGGTFNTDITACVAEGYIAYEADQVWKIATDLAAAVEAVNASANGGTITLFADVDFSEDVYAGYKWAGEIYNPLTITNSNVTIDLNGHTISNMGNTAICAGNILAADGGISNFTIKNGTLLAGKTSDITNSYVLGIAGVNGASIKNVTTNGGINVYSGSTNVVIDGCAINGTKYYAVCAQSGSDVTIKNSEVTKNTDSSVKVKIMFWTQGAGSDSDMATTANPTGAFGASVITIESGSYTMNADGVFTSGVNPVVKGGTFNFDPTACVDTENYVVTENDGVYTVSAK